MIAIFANFKFLSCNSLFDITVSSWERLMKMTHQYKGAPHGLYYPPETAPLFINYSVTLHEKKSKNGG